MKPKKQNEYAAAVAEVDAAIETHTRIIDLTRMCMDTENDRDEQLAVLQEAIIQSHIEIASDNPYVESLIVAYKDYVTSIRAHARARTSRMAYEIELTERTIAALREQRK